MLPDPRALFDILGLRRRGFLRALYANLEEFALHPTVLSLLVNADWRLESLLRDAALTPIHVTVVSNGELNTTLHNRTDERLSIAPMFMPVAPGVGFASRLRWLPVQRGMLVIMEELARAAVHNHSALLHEVEELQGHETGPQSLSSLDVRDQYDFVPSKRPVPSNYCTRWCTCTVMPICVTMNHAYATECLGSPCSTSGGYLASRRRRIVRLRHPPEIKENWKWKTVRCTALIRWQPLKTNSAMSSALSRDLTFLLEAIVLAQRFAK